MRQARPIGHRRIDHGRGRECEFAGSRQSPCPAGFGPPIRISDSGTAAPYPLGAVTEAIGLSPLAVLGEEDRGARGAEQAGTGFGDLLQRMTGIAGGAGDGAQDFGAGASGAPAQSLARPAAGRPRSRLIEAAAQDRHACSRSATAFWGSAVIQSIRFALRHAGTGSIRASGYASPAAHGNGLFHPRPRAGFAPNPKRRAVSLRSPALTPRSPCW